MRERKPPYATLYVERTQNVRHKRKKILWINADWRKHWHISFLSVLLPICVIPRAIVHTKSKEHDFILCTRVFPFRVNKFACGFAALCMTLQQVKDFSFETMATLARSASQRIFPLARPRRPKIRWCLAKHPNRQLLVAHSQRRCLLHCRLGANVALGLHVTAVKTYPDRPSFSCCGHRLHGQQRLPLSGWWTAPLLRALSPRGDPD